MTRARLTAHRDITVSPIDRRLYGSFVEHMGRCVYTGIYEPGHPTADARGFRRDVADLIREMGVTLVRYPGGNFVSGYDWEDGVGPVEDRPRRLDPAWLSLETNKVGTNEFMTWCRELDLEPMFAFNFGTRGLDAARRFLEYCNHPGGTALSDLRRSHGVEEPHGIRLWCLGNEMDGPWQIGAKTAHEYGRLAQETAKVLRLLDPNIELFACGSSNRDMTTYARWEYEVLDHCFEHVDYISLHTYFQDKAGTPAGYLEEIDRFDAYIGEVVAIADAVAATRRSQKRIMLAMDEWNVWSRTRASLSLSAVGNQRPWPEHPPLIEEVYDVTDALMIGGALITMMNHADRVKVACLAQLVNILGPILTEPGGPAWRQTIFHPFALAARHGHGTVLKSAIDCDTYDGPTLSALPCLCASVCHDPGSGRTTIFALNRDMDEEMSLEIALDGFSGDAGERRVSAVQIAEDELRATNTKSHPDRVVPRPLEGVEPTGGGLKATLRPASFNVIIVH